MSGTGDNQAAERMRCEEVAAAMPPPGDDDFEVRVSAGRMVLTQWLGRVTLVDGARVDEVTRRVEELWRAGDPDAARRLVARAIAGHERTVSWPPTPDHLTIEEAYSNLRAAITEDRVPPGLGHVAALMLAKNIADRPEDGPFPCDLLDTFRTLLRIAPEASADWRRIEDVIVRSMQLRTASLGRAVVRALREGRLDDARARHEQLRALAQAAPAESNAYAHHADALAALARAGEPVREDIEALLPVLAALERHHPFKVGRARRSLDAARAASQA